MVLLKTHETCVFLSHLLFSLSLHVTEDHPHVLTVRVVLTRCQGPRQPQPPPGRSSRSAGDSQMINGVGESSAEEGAKRSSSRHQERKGQPQGGGGARAEAGRTGAVTNAGGWEGGHLKLPRHRAPLTRCHFSCTHSM